MEREEVINPGLAIWFVQYSLHKSFPLVWKAEGTALDGYHGFGDRQKGYFEGEVILLTLEEKLIQHLLVSSVHISREGFKWFIRKAKELPKPPFLISSDLAIQVIFNGEVEVRVEREFLNLSEPSDYIYSIGSKAWFGVMTVKEDNKVHLVAFSPNKKETVLENDELWSYEWDCPAGRIESLKVSFR